MRLGDYSIANPARLVTLNLENDGTNKHQKRSRIVPAMSTLPQLLSKNRARPSKRVNGVGEVAATGQSGLGGDGKPRRISTKVYGDHDNLPRDVINRKLSIPNAGRIFSIHHDLRASFTIEEIFSLTRIDRWFLVSVREIVDVEEELAMAGD